MARIGGKVETRGDVSMRETPNSPRITWQEGGTITVQREWSGMFTDLLSRVPASGSKLDGYPELGDQVVRDASLVHGNGDRGTLTVNYAPPSCETGDDEEDEGELDVTMQSVEKPLLLNPYFAGKVNAGKIEAWKKESSPELTAKYAYQDEKGEEVKLDGLDKEAAELITEGTECYLTFAPVVSLTQRFSIRPSSVGRDNGKIQRPPVKVEGSWEFLRQGDVLTRDSSGAWTLRRMWLGAEEWNRKLYKAAGG